MSRDSKSSNSLQVKTIQESLSQIIPLFNALKGDFGANISEEDFIEVLNLISSQRKTMMESLFFSVANIAYSTEESSEEALIIENILSEYFNNNPLIKKYFLTGGNQDIYDYYDNIRNLTKSEDGDRPNVPQMSRAIDETRKKIETIKQCLEIFEAEYKTLKEEFDTANKQCKKAREIYRSIESKFKYYDSLMKRSKMIREEINKLPPLRESLSNQYYEYEDKMLETKEYIEELGYSEEEIRDKIIEIEENQEASDKVAQDTDYNALDELQGKLGAILSAKKDMASYIDAKEKIEKAIERIDKRYNQLFVDLENINKESESYNIGHMQEDKEVAASRVITSIKGKNEINLLLLSNGRQINENYRDLDVNSEILENLQCRKADYLLEIMLDLNINSEYMKKLFWEQSERFQHILDLRYPDDSNLLERLCPEDQNEPVTNKSINEINKFIGFLVIISSNNLSNLSEYIGSSNINIGNIKKELLDYVIQISSPARPEEEKAAQPRDDVGQEVPAEQEDLQEQGRQQDADSNPQSQATPLESEKLNGREENSQKR